eukprot:192644-Pyramimonas_sp.AAC.1
MIAFQASLSALRGNPLRDRSRGPAVAAAAEEHLGASAPTPKDPARRRGPTPGRTHGTGRALSLEGSSKDASSSKGGAKYMALENISKASGAAPKISGHQFFDVREKDKTSGIASSSAAPAAPAASAPVRAHGEPAVAPAGQPAIAFEMPEACSRYWEQLGTPIER